ncbi:MAG: UrcA family protein [Novosphingobium sp.]|nr:UrcA family protein [Novosphingobium sp.]
MFKTALIATGLAGLVFAAQPALARSAAVAAAPAGANPDMLVEQRLVHIADLDLSTAAGQARFDARLRRAAAAVCETNAGPHPLSEAMEGRRCYRNAIQSAQRAMADRGVRFSTVKVAAR